MSAELHARKIFSQIKQEGIAKYLKGYRTYGTNLWDYSLGWLVKNAKEEVIDQVSYVWTIEEQVERLNNSWSILRTELDLLEEPLSSGGQEQVYIIDKVLRGI